MNLLPVLLLVQPRMLLAFLAARADCWLMFSLLSTKIPRSFSTALLPSCLVPSLYYCQGLFLPICRASHLSLLNFPRFLLAHSSSLFRSLWNATLPFSIIDWSSQFGNLCKCEYIPSPLSLQQSC